MTVEEINKLLGAIANVTKASEEALEQKHDIISDMSRAVKAKRLKDIPWTFMPGVGECSWCGGWSGERPVVVLFMEKDKSYVRLCKSHYGGLIEELGKYATLLELTDDVEDYDVHDKMAVSEYDSR